MKNFNYKVSRSYMVSCVAEVTASTPKEAEKIARTNDDGMGLHWKEYDGDYIEDVDFTVEQVDD